MTIISRTIIVIAAFLMLSINLLSAQQKVELLTIEEQQTVIDSICSKITAIYVFPDLTEKIVSDIQSRLKNGEYTSTLDPLEFAAMLTDDIEAVSNDLHFNVSFDPDRIAEEQSTVTAEESEVILERRINSMKRDNFGFKEVEILAGNIGYLDFRSFSYIEYAEETAVSAMNFLSNSDAIIIDLRYNGGGSPTMVQLIASYLFESDTVHLNSFYHRASESFTQEWTFADVSGTRSPNTPVYILTSGRTGFSSGSVQL